MKTVYLITCKENGKRYIGQTVLDLSERWKMHCYYKPNRDLVDDIFMYGKKAFTIEALCECPSFEAMNKAEKFFIEFLGTRKKSLGYNKHAGGTHRAYPDTSKYTKEEIRSIIKQKAKNKQELKQFIDYEIFRIPEGERMLYESILVQEGYMRRSDIRRK